MSTLDPIAAGERRAAIAIMRVMLANDPYRDRVLFQLSAAKEHALDDLLAGGLDPQARAAFEATFEEVMHAPKPAQDPAEGAGA